MGRKEVEKIRDGSRGYQAAKKYKKESIWDSDFGSMGLKTAIGRICKFLPKWPEMAAALALDAAADLGKDQNLNLNEVIEGNYTPIIDDDGRDQEEKMVPEHLTTSPPKAPGRTPNRRARRLWTLATEQAVLRPTEPQVEAPTASLTR